MKERPLSGYIVRFVNAGPYQTTAYGSKPSETVEDGHVHMQAGPFQSRGSAEQYGREIIARGWSPYFDWRMDIVGVEAEEP